MGQGTEEGRAAAEVARGQSGGCCRKRGGDALILQQGAGTATLLRGGGRLGPEVLRAPSCHWGAAEACVTPAFAEMLCFEPHPNLI